MGTSREGKRITGGIHVYGGDFFETARTQLNPEPLAEEPPDGETSGEILRNEPDRLTCWGNLNSR